MTKLAPLLLLLAALVLAPLAAGAHTQPRSWASSEIGAVTHAGILGSSPATFAPQAPLTERALQAAIAASDRLLHPPAPPTPPPPPAPTPAPAPTPPQQVLSTIGDGATLSGTVAWVVQVPAQQIVQVAFAVDGRQLAASAQASYTLATASLADGPHQLAVAATRADGQQYVAAWTVTTANAPGIVPAPAPTQLVPVPVTHAPPVPKAAPAPTPAPAPVVAQPAEQGTPKNQLYVARTPSSAVTISQLDSALVNYLGLLPAAAEFEHKLRLAGLQPRASAGTEIVARLLQFRYTHPSNHVDLALLPNMPATRAEAAYSFAQLLRIGAGGADWVQGLADQFTMPSLNAWQRRILATAVSYIGYPYVWGGTSPTSEAPFGVRAPGGFDCSGFAWRVFKLTPYAGERDLASVLRGRTTYEMSGEVPRSLRLSASRLRPADAMFFGRGVHSKPSEVDHMAIYLGNGWLIESSGQGVTIDPFAGWHAESFAWGRSPLHEAGLE
jgi:cell wall-associated NlpC family hydrolase